MKKVLQVAVAALVAALFSLPAFAYFQVIDDFESGSIGSMWSIDGSTADVGLFNSIEVKQWGGVDVQYASPEGDWMAVLNGGDLTTTFRTNFVAYSGAVLRFSWLGEFLDGEIPAPNNGVTEVYNDTVGFRLNGSEIILADAITTTLGVGLDNTRWQELVYALPMGDITLDFWARNEGDSYNDPRLAIDNIRVAYAGGIPLELVGGGGTGGGTTPAIPEPSTVVLFGIGLLALSLTVRRRNRVSAKDIEWCPSTFRMTRER
jgi:hypothetical protein